MSKIEAGKALASIIKKDCRAIPNGRLPQITISSYGRRSDLSPNPLEQLLDEYNGKYRNTDFPKPRINNNNNIIAFTLPPASPHTSKVFDFKGTNCPAHLNVWWGEIGKDKQITILDLARMPKEQRQPYLKAIASQIQKGVLFLGTKIEDLSRLPQNEWHELLEIYGLGGYASPKERKSSGLSRGAQSHPSGHLNIVYHPYEKYHQLAKVEPSTPREILKHIGPMDTVIFEWEKFFLGIIGAILTKNQHTQCRIESEQIHGIRPDNKSISFYEGFGIQYDNPGLPLDEALNDLCDIIGFFDQFYTILRKGYDQYHLHINQDRVTEEIRLKIIDDLFSLLSKIKTFNSNDEILHSKQILGEIVDFSLSFMPTYQQIINWLENPNLSQETISYLERKKSQYERFLSTFEEIKKLNNPNMILAEDERKKLQEKKDRVLKGIKLTYGFTFDLEAEIFWQFLIDMVQPGENWKNIEYTWSSYLSVSYLVDQYSFDKDGNLHVKKLTLAPRLFTNKGVFEDLAGIVIKRPQGV